MRNKNFINKYKNYLNGKSKMVWLFDHDKI